MKGNISWYFLILLTSLLIRLYICNRLFVCAIGIAQCGMHVDRLLNGHWAHMLTAYSAFTGLIIILIPTWYLGHPFKAWGLESSLFKSLPCVLWDWLWFVHGSRHWRASFGCWTYLFIWVIFNVAVPLASTANPNLGGCGCILRQVGAQYWHINTFWDRSPGEQPDQVWQVRFGQQVVAVVKLAI